MKNEIGEFITKSIEQIKSGLPKDCEVNSNIDFDISVITTSSKEGKIGIQLAGVGGTASTKLIHRLRFSIIDKKSRDKNVKFVTKWIKEMASELPEIEEKR